jgi:hypothetical protein
VDFGGSQTVTVYVTPEDDAAETATVTLHAASEGDPSRVAEAAFSVSR